MKSLTRTIALIGCVISTAGATAGGTPYATITVQCRGTDRTIPKTIRFARGRTTAVVKDTIRLCTSHEYHLRARQGQTMSIHLATGKRTSFTLLTPSGDTVGDADGVKDWSGELMDNGEYIINIGTDATAAYTLEVTVR
jgi:hypothetical protein